MTKYSPAGVGFIDLTALLSLPVYILVLSLCIIGVYRSDSKPTSNLYICKCNLTDVSGCTLGSGVDKPIGEVSVQIELHTHPKSGERKVTARGLFEFS